MNSITCIPATQLVTQPVTQPTTQPATQPVAQPATQSATQSATQPATLPATQSATQPATQSATQSTTNQPFNQPALTLFSSTLNAPSVFSICCLIQYSTALTSWLVVLSMVFTCQAQLALHTTDLQQQWHTDLTTKNARNAHYRTKVPLVTRCRRIEKQKNSETCSASATQKLSSVASIHSSAAALNGATFDSSIVSTCRCSSSDTAIDASAAVYSQPAYPAAHLKALHTRTKSFIRHKSPL